jgi:uncharacterized protein (TIGR00369 family)
VTTFLDSVGMGEPEPDGSVRLSATSAHANLHDTVHGGLLATMLDAAMGAAVRSGLNDKQSAATVSITVTYLEPGRVGDDLTAVAEVLQRGSSLVMVQGRVEAGADDRGACRPIAHAVATFSVIGDS